MLECSHDPDHIHRGPRSLDPSIMVSAEASDFCLFFIIKEKNPVNDWLAGSHLQLRQSMAHRIGNVFSVCGLPLEDRSKTDDRFEFRVIGSRQACCDHGNFKRPRNPYHFHTAHATRAEFGARSLDQGIGVLGVIPGGDDCDRSISNRFLRTLSNLRQHGGNLLFSHGPDEPILLNMFVDPAGIRFRGGTSIQSIDGAKIINSRSALEIGDTR